jgi:hypothetical protein
MMHMGKRKGEKEVGLSDILQELKKQTFINRRQSYINLALSVYIVLFTVAILFYEVSNSIVVAVVSGVIIVVVILALIWRNLEKNKLN